MARLIMDFVLLTTAVEVAPRWRELAEKLAHVSKQQMEAYEAPHRDKTGMVDSEVRKQNLLFNMKMYSSHLWVQSQDIAIYIHLVISGHVETSL